jgi:hypothetical protein
MMTWTNFYNRVAELDDVRRKALMLKPDLNSLPLPIQRYDDPFLPLGKEVVRATESNVGIYIFDMASYFATGAAGIVALERTIAYARNRSLTILHGPFTGKHYGTLTNLAVDAFTVSTEQDHAYYLQNSPYTPFLWNAEAPRIGGGMNESMITVSDDQKEQFTMPIYDLGDVMTDFTDTFADSLKAHLA